MRSQDNAVEALVIFIANDRPDDQYLYRQAFGQACPSAVLYFFTHKAELLEALSSQVYPVPSLLIMDWDMDRYQGYTTLALVAATPICYTIPVIILAKPDQPIDEDSCEKLGYEIVITKEIMYSRLVGQLQGLVRAFA
ncbi:response regulator [Spirosoma sp. RP8]|uniref:Response regulator n=1 Tax=Spirosoma liriopis TaxID=2937440 RepID=A0ABT0HT67_9BACT|nr:response regulator [Spirosoma liriopis]MCK8495175.1 response regulator [Spirosoma liriopis]